MMQLEFKRQYLFRLMFQILYYVFYYEIFSFLSYDFIFFFTYFYIRRVQSIFDIIKITLKLLIFILIFKKEKHCELGNGIDRIDPFFENNSKIISKRIIFHDYDKNSKILEGIFFFFKLVKMYRSFPSSRKQEFVPI